MLETSGFEDYLWEWIEYLAKESDGHFTLMKFSSHWKAMFFTPNLDTKDGRDQVREGFAGKTRKEALIIAIGEKLKTHKEETP